MWWCMIDVSDVINLWWKYWSNAIVNEIVVISTSAKDNIVNGVV